MYGKIPWQCRTRFGDRMVLLHARNCLHLYACNNGYYCRPLVACPEGSRPLPFACRSVYDGSDLVWRIGRCECGVLYSVHTL